MWKKIKTSDLFISFSESYEIYVTDYVSIWFEHFTKNTFLRKLRHNNSLLEMSEEALLEKGLHMLSSPDKLKSLEIKHDDKILTLNMTMLFGYPFKLTLNLSKGSNNMFFQKITQPHLKTIQELKSSQLELCQLLNKKDSEIEEYKCAGGEIALKHLKTKPFDEKGVLSKYTAFEEQFGSTNDILCGLINKVVENPEDIRKVKQETNEESTNLETLKIKIELQSQNSVSNGSSNIKMASVKTESTLEIPCVPEPNGQNLTIKEEPNSMAESQSLSGESAVLNVKCESESPVKRESQTIPINRKKVKKLF